MTLRHEAQAQLQLALLGVPSETMERSNAGPISIDLKPFGSENVMKRPPNEPFCIPFAFRRCAGGIRKTFMFSPDAKIGDLSGAMKGLMQLTREDSTLGRPCKSI